MDKFNITIPQEAVNATVDFSNMLNKIIYTLEEVLSGYEVLSIKYWKCLDKIIITLDGVEIIVQEHSVTVKSEIDRRDYSEYR